MSLTRLKAFLRCSLHGRCLPKSRPLVTSTSIHSKKTTDVVEEDPSKPLVYTQTKAASMTVGVSFGEKHKRPLKKVIPISVIGFGLLIWIYTREETEIDELLRADLHDNVPGLFENIETNEVPVEENEKEGETR